MNILIDDNDLAFASVNIINCGGGINHFEVPNETISGIIARNIYNAVMPFHNEGMLHYALLQERVRCIGSV